MGKSSGVCIVFSSADIRTHGIAVGGGGRLRQELTMSPSRAVWCEDCVRAAVREKSTRSAAKPKVAEGIQLP